MRLVFTLILFVLCAACVNAPPSPVNIFLNGDGTVEIEGARYSDEETLKTKIQEVKQRKPQQSFEIVSRKSEKIINFEMVGRAIVLLMRAGAIKPGFIVSPKEVE